MPSKFYYFPLKKNKTTNDCTVKRDGAVQEQAFYKASPRQSLPRECPEKQRVHKVGGCRRHRCPRSLGRLPGPSRGCHAALSGAGLGLVGQPGHPSAARPGRHGTPHGRAAPAPSPLAPANPPLRHRRPGAGTGARAGQAKTRRACRRAARRAAASSP